LSSSPLVSSVVFSGFVVLHAVCSAATVDIALLPEMEIDLEKVLAHMEAKIIEKVEDLPHSLRV
jgi:hypothetical protein